MRKFINIIIAILSCSCIYAQQYDFSAVCSTGQTLYYKITSVDKQTVSIVPPQDIAAQHLPDYWGYYKCYYGSYSSKKPSGNLIIPSTVANNGITYKINSIAQHAFYDCKGLLSVVIGENIESIGSAAFDYDTYYYSSPQLHTLIWNAKKLLSVSSFSGLERCSNLNSVYFGDSVNYIPSFALKNCSSITNLIISNSVTSIGESAFYGCSGVICLTIPNSVFTIGANAFLGCTGLTNLTIGENVTTIGNNAFQECNSLSNLSIPNSVTSIGTYAFSQCIGITTITIGENVISIGNNAFQGCTGISNLTIPNSVTTIGANAFFNCSSITNLTIGENVTTIGNCAFQGCSGIKTINYNAKNCTTLLCYPETAPFYTALKNNLETLIIGNSVQKIPKNAFYDCQVLNSLTIGENVTSIGNYAFMDCPNLTSVILPNSLKTIGAHAFRNCSGLTEITIPDSITTIEECTFYDCSGLTTINFNDKITSIGDYAFANCSNISSITIPNSVVSIGNGAFRFNTTMTNLSIGDNVTTIGNYAFRNCNNLSSVQFSPSLQSIGKKAFYDCDNIITVNIDSAAVSIGDSTFADCDRLVTVDIENATMIGDGAFAGDFRLVNINMGDSVFKIGNAAFKDCIRLKSPKLPSNLTYIGNNAFQNCKLISGQLTIPSKVDTIGAAAYSGCDSITSLFMKPQNPPTIFATTFDSINPIIPVYVPCGRVINYFTTNYWENFPNLLEQEPFQITLTVNNEAMGSAIVTSQPTCSSPQAIIKANANEGFHFIHWNDGNTNNPRILSLTEDIALEALFTINQSYITVHSNDTMKGNVTGSGIYVYNAPAVLSATANNGYHFIQWSDGNTSNPRFVTAKQDSVFTAVFVSNISNIVLFNNNPDMGTVSGGGIYYYQNYATLAALPLYGYHFTNWNDGNTDNPRMLLVDRDTSFTASFALNMYSISASSENSTMGNVSGGGSYNYNMQISIEATPNYGYHFFQWSDGNTQNPRNITVTKDSIFTAQFSANSYTLSVSANDPDMGSAYGAGTFNYNYQTTISAVANYGYHFTQWSDGNTENPRIVTITSNREYTAVFAVNFYTINVNSSNPAMGNASGGGTYSFNSNISIFATPNYGYHFIQWSDGNTQNPRNVTIMQNSTYTAQFAVNTYAVSVYANNASMGNISGSSNYIYNTIATVSATPNYGYHFVQWNDGNTDNPRSIIVTQNEVLTAQFDFNTYILTTVSNNYIAGSVIGGGTYNYNSIVSVNAVPNEHYHFVQWGDLITDNPRNITITQDTMITAQFALDNHNVSIVSNNSTMGTVSGSGIYPYGNIAQISASSNYGYHFVQWSDGNTNNPRVISVSKDTTLIAIFDYNIYSANINSLDTIKGSVSGYGNYQYLSQITITATPKVGHHFVQWSDGNIENPRLITITKDTLISAIFEINTYQVNINSNNSAMGSVTGTGIYPYNTTVTITATPSAHHHFVQWSDGNTSNPRQIVVLSDITIESFFAEDEKYDIIVQSSDIAMGYTSGSGTYYAGTPVTISAIPNEHYKFVQWMDGITENQRTITVIENSTFTANFEPMQYDILAYSSNELMGTVTGGGTYSYNTEIELKAIPNLGYHFVSWNDGDTNMVRNLVVQQNDYYIANFAEGVGIDSYSKFDVQIFPNPAYDYINICCEDFRRVEIYDCFGKILLKTTDKHIDVSKFARGMYYVKIYLDAEIITKRLILD